MGKHLQLLSLGGACLLVFVLALLPARAAFMAFAPDELDAFGVNGTLWNGEAKIISINGLQLRNTEWSLSLGQLLLGRAGGEFKTRWHNGFIEGYGSFSVGGTIRLSDTKAGFDASLLAQFGAPALGGQFSADISELKLTDMWPEILIAKAEVSNLSSPLMGRGESSTIGNFSLVVDSTTEPDPSEVTGKIQDTGGPLELQGTVKLSVPSNYELQARLKARPSAPPSLEQNLTFLGPAGVDGAREFKFTGSF